MIFRSGGKYLKRNGKYANNANCCCDCTECGLCKFSPHCQAILTWSFSIDDGAVDLYGSGTTWAAAVASNPTLLTDFNNIKAGTATADVDLTAAFPTTGITGFTKLLPYGGGPATFTAQSYYECDLKEWGFGVYGNNRLTHNDRAPDTAFPLGVFPGSCSGASNTNAIYDVLASQGWLATGSFSIAVIHNPCEGVP